MICGICGHCNNKKLRYALECLLCFSSIHDEFRSGIKFKKRRRDFFKSNTNDEGKLVVDLYGTVKCWISQVSLRMPSLRLRVASQVKIFDNFW